MDQAATQKSQAEQLLHRLPEESTLEDIQYHLYVLEKIRQGQADIVAGKSFSHDEATQRLSKWL